MFLGIDVGTTSTKCILVSAEGQTLSKSHVDNRLICPQAGWVEQDPNELSAGVMQCLKDLNTNEGVACVGITNQRETIVAVRKSTKQPLFNAVSWMDVRTDSIVSEFKEKALALGCFSEYEQRTGLKFSTYFSAFKIIWLLQNSKQVQMAKDENDLVFCTMDSWILNRLTNADAFFTDTTNASRTFLMNLATSQWDSELLDFFGIKSSWLPNILPTVDSNFGTISTSLPFSGSLVASLCGDQMSSYVGHWGRDFLNKAKCTFGTGAFLVLNSSGSDGSALRTPLPSDGSSAVFAHEFPIVCAGSLVSWLKNNLRMISNFEDLDNFSYLDIQKSPASSSVYFLPNLSGCLYPLWDPASRGSFQNLTLQSTREQFILSTLEAIAFCIRMTLDEVDVDALSVDGGMCVSRSFCQLLADVCNCEIRILAHNDATCFGAIILASKFSVNCNSLSDTLLPNQELAPIYDSKFAYWKSLWINL